MAIPTKVGEKIFKLQKLIFNYLQNYYYSSL